MADDNTDRQLQVDEHRTRMKYILGNRMGLSDYVTSIRGNKANCRQHFTDSVLWGTRFGAAAGLAMGMLIGVKNKEAPGNMVARVGRACAVSIPMGALMFTGAGLFVGVAYCLFYPVQERRR